MSEVLLQKRPQILIQIFALILHKIPRHVLILYKIAFYVKTWLPVACHSTLLYVEGVPRR
jgi:hypothetical protein